MKTPKEEHLKWQAGVIETENIINQTKIENESKVLTMWKRNGRIPEVSFIKRK